MYLKYFIPVSVFISAAALAAPLNAQAIELVSQSVPYADLNLERAEGRDALDRRIEVAVRQVCSELSAKDLAFNRAVRNCRSASRAAAMQQRDIAVANYVDRNARAADLASRNR